MQTAVPLAMAHAPLPILLAEDLVFTEEETESEIQTPRRLRAVVGMEPGDWQEGGGRSS